MKPLSIRASLTAWFVGLTSLLLVAFSATLYLSISAALHSGLEGRLATAANGLVALCGWEEEGWFAEFEASDELATQLATSQPGRRQEVFTWPELRPLFRAGKSLELPLPDPAAWGGDHDLESGPLVSFATLDGEAGRERVCTVLALSPAVAGIGQEPSTPAFAVLVRVADSLAPVETQLARIAWIVVVLAGVSAAVVLGFGVLLSRRVVRPLHALGRAADEIRAGRAAKLPHRGVGDEVDRLAEHLEDAFQRLEGALQRQTRFTSDAAHELRNPISVIQNASEVALRRERSGEEYREFLGDVFATSKRMGRVVEALLLLARLDAGTASAAFKEVDLVDIARDSASVQPAAQGRVEVHNGDAAVVRGDDALLRVLVDNLLSNALRYSGPDSKVSVTVQNGDGVTLSVADQGPGIPKDHVGRVFDRFYRVESANPDAPGAGLGLALVAEVARLHSAQSSIDSSEAGTRVTVRFPTAPEGT